MTEDVKYEERARVRDAKFILWIQVDHGVWAPDTYKTQAELNLALQNGVNEAKPYVVTTGVLDLLRDNSRPRGFGDRQRERKQRLQAARKA